MRRFQAKGPQWGQRTYRDSIFRAGVGRDSDVQHIKPGSGLRSRSGTPSNKIAIVNGIGLQGLVTNIDRGREP
jgi:hypothetical protein